MSESEVPDLLGALIRAVDKAREDRRQRTYETNAPAATTPAPATPTRAGEPAERQETSS